MKMKTVATIGRAVVILVITACGADQRVNDNYEEARKVFWSQLYSQGGETLYCGTRFSSTGRRGLNIEHVFPMSWVTRAVGCGRRKECRETSPLFNRIEADLHNLYPTRADLNDARGSFRFGEISGERRMFGDCDFEVDQRQRVFEPRAASRGEIARAMFYMHREYGLTIFRRQGKMLQQWHRRDPPDSMERERNDRIEIIQGNRNPYIDRPGLADQLRF
jgi:deoxyribonuclease-1